MATMFELIDAANALQDELNTIGEAEYGVPHPDSGVGEEVNLSFDFCEIKSLLVSVLNYLDRRVQRIRGDKVLTGSQGEIGIRVADHLAGVKPEPKPGEQIAIVFEAPVSRPAREKYSTSLEAHIDAFEEIFEREYRSGKSWDDAIGAAVAATRPARESAAPAMASEASSRGPEGGPQRPAEPALN